MELPASFPKCFIFLVMSDTAGLLQFSPRLAASLLSFTAVAERRRQRCRRDGFDELRASRGLAGGHPLRKAAGMAFLLCLWGREGGG